MTGTDIELLSPQGQRAVTWWAHNPQIPASYLDKQGRVRMADAVRAALLCERLHLDVEAVLGDTFVIGGTVGFKADLQRMVLIRHPGYDFEVLEVDDEHCTARLRTPTGWKPPITKRITDKDIRSYAKRNATNYADKSRRMLEARVTTELIDLYAKGVLRNMAVEALPGVEFTDADESALDVLAAGEAAPRSVAPDGHTIPAANREDEVDSDVRAGLRATLSILEREQPAVFVALQVRWTATTRPPLGSPNFTVSHGQLLEYMIAEAIGPSVNPGSGSGSAAVEPDPGPTEHVHDDSPEAYGPDEEPFE